MEDELNGVVPCSSLAVESTIRVGTAGALWGLCMGPYNSRKNGLSGVDHAAFVAKSVGKNGFQCAKQIDCGCGRRSCNCYKD
ncbi:outer envelope pore protein 16-4, chloroplastic-like isoform X2 [Cucurbita pepo subsp. pepo]|uniref:outer envelope pore protein 16-4, chloroplastic-like isoform X2 n=1 Tax=Cucurbita pepo subsp. pepo TaxID=3664 RepID=UPI000C9D60B9|nr:outer envelope pore protein 16-4, chloroplastic-like isoform X2 [Cucurbita pepo subsp. pepo]